MAFAVRDVQLTGAVVVVKRVAKPEPAARAKTSGFALRSGIAMPGLPPVAMPSVVDIYKLGLGECRRDLKKEHKKRDKV